MEHVSTNIAWTVIKNATSQVGGRMILSLARFGIAVLIVRTAGVERFGEFSLILSILLIAEWLVDFGSTDIAVRDISQAPDRKNAVLNAVSAMKGIQTVAVVFLFLAFLILMRYPTHIFRSGVIAALDVVFFSGILIYRIVFRTRMTMEKDVLSEVVGVLVVIPLIWIACVRGADLEVLVGCYVLSRAIFFSMTLFMGGRHYIPKPLKATRADVQKTAWAALPIGVGGLLAGLYEAIDPILLSQFANTAAVGHFSAASRFLFPIVIVIQSIANTVFPLLSRYWNQDEERFRATLHGAIKVALLIAAGLFCFIFTSAEFLMSLLGDEMIESANVLRILSWTIITRALAAVLTPLFIISGYQHRTIWLIAVAVLAKFGLLSWLVPNYGATGAAISYLISELAFGVIPIFLLTRYLVGFRMNWSVLIRIALSVMLSLGICSLANIQGTLISGLLAMLLFAIAVVVSKITNRNELQFLLAGARQRFDRSEK